VSGEGKLMVLEIRNQNVISAEVTEAWTSSHCYIHAHMQINSYALILAKNPLCIYLVFIYRVSPYNLPQTVGSMFNAGQKSHRA